MTRLTLTAFLLAWTAFGQVDTGTISGTVKDQSGAIIQAAVVKVKNEATGISVSSVTNADGLYSVPDLKAGVYSVSALASGFETVIKNGIEVRVQDRIPVNFSLTVGTASTIISVQSEAPPLQTETSSVGNVVESAEINSIPLNGRNYIQLASLGAGTTPAYNSSERNSFYANGVREIQNSYLLDGIDNKNKIVGFDSSAAQSIEPVIDSVEEFKVQTSTFSAEFGQAAGAVVNVTTKSGSNQIHGSVFDYVRNSVFDADPYFQPADTTKPHFTQNQYGGVIGGPIVKDRTFLFLGWQSSRTEDAAPQLAAVPTNAQKDGIFSTAIYDPATTVPNPHGSGYIRTAFAGDVVPASRFDPVANQLLALYPTADLAGKNNFFSNQTEKIAQDQYVGRFDHRFSDKDSVFSRFSMTRNTNVLPAPLPPPANDISLNSPGAHNFVTSETHIFSPTLLNEARIGYQETQEIQQTEGVPRLFSQYGIIGADNYPQVLGLPTFAVSGLTTLGTTGPGTLQTAATGSGNQPIDKEGRTIQVNDSLTWTHGRHNIKFGFDFQQVTLYADVTLNARPSYSFTGVYTENPQSRSTTGAPFADFLLGEAASATVGTRVTSNSRQHIYQGYVQDDWKLTSRLTINAGLRYELPLPFYETSNNYVDLILDPGPEYGKLLSANNAGQYGYPISFAEANYHNFAPRLGLAYQLTPKTVIRAASGIFYGRDENLAVADRPTNNPPYYVTTTYTSDQIDPNIILSKGFPSNWLSSEVNPTVNSFGKHMPTPYVQQWNFTVQQELFNHFTAQVAYVGSSSHDLYVDDNLNQPAPAAGAIQARRPLNDFATINAYLPLVSAHYDGLQAQLERRFSKGVTLLAAYTFSHGLDDDTSTPEDAYNYSLEKASSNFDIRQRFVLSSVYELPFGKGKPFLNSSHIGNLVLGGWQLTGIFTAQTGLPFTPVESVDASNTGTTERPNLIGDPALASGHRSTQEWFNLTAFAAPAAYTFGDSGRNILRGPGLVNTDLGLSRVIPITERVNITFRAEAFNLFNTPEFGLPNATIGNATAGTITTVINPQRELQFALRLAF
jgi:outer membrane receptor protein involved in Fe transport